MATRTFNGTTNTTFSTASNWDGGVSVPSSGDTLIIASNCVLTSSDSNIYGTLTINSSINFNIQTFDFNCNLVTINGTLQMGNSATNGLTCVGLVANIGSHINLASSSIINNSSNLSLANSYLFTVNYRGIYKQIGSGNYSNQSQGNIFNTFIQNSGVTTTLTNNSYIGDDSCSNVTINGIIDGAYTLSTGVNSTGNFTIGTNGDFQCSSLSFMIVNGATLVNNRTTPFTVTDVSCQSLDEMVIPGWDFTNASVYVNGPYNSGSRYISDGTLHCINLTFYADVMANFIMYNSASLIISGNVNFKASIDNVSYTKGGGTITLIGTSGTQTLDFNDQSVEPIIVNASGSIKQMVVGKNVSTTSLTITAGTFDVNTCNCTVNGIVSVSGTLKMGTSVSNGLICNGLTINSGSSVDLQNAYKITNSGNYFCNYSTIWVSNLRGTYTQIGSGTYASNSGNNIFYSWTQNSGVTTTLTANTYLGNPTSSNFTVNGTIDGLYTLIIGVGSTSTMTFGVNSDISTSTLLFYSSRFGTYVNNKITPFTVTTVNLGQSSLGNLCIPAWDFSNSNISIQNANNGTVRYVQGSGTLSCINFTITTTSGNPFTLSCVDNSNFNISGNISFSTLDTVTYTKGSGTITLVGTTGTQTIDFNGASVEPIVVNAPSAVKQLVSSKNVSTPSLTVSGGTFDINTCSCNVSGAVSVSNGVLKASTSTPTLFSDIPYTRNGTTATVTLNNHGFLYGERPTITVRSDSSTFSLSTYLAYNHTTDTFDLNCTNSGSLSGTISFTVPLSGCGLSLGSLTFGANTTGAADFAISTRIDNYGNLTIPNGSVWKTSGTGIYCQRGSATLSSSNGNGFLPYTTIIYPTVTVTPATSLIIGSNASAMIFSLYGTISSNTFFTLPGNGGLYFDTNSDIVGTGQCTIYNEQDYPLSDIRKTSDLSFTGTFIWSGNSGSLRKPLALGTSGEIKFGQGITNACTMKLQPSSGFGNIIRCSKLTLGVGTTNTGVILNNTNNIEIQCSGQVDLGMCQSISYESKWNKNGTNVRIGSVSLSSRSSNVPVSLTNSSDLNTLPNDIYPTSSIRQSSTLSWTKADANDTFITVVENNTPLQVNDSFQVLTSSNASLFVSDIPTVISKTTNDFNIPITIECIWERVGTTAYITVPKPFGLTTANTIYISICSDLSTIPIGVYSIDGINGTQMRITCNNSGSLSGTLTYNTRYTSGTLSYGYLNVTVQDTIGSGTNGTCHLNGITNWVGGTSKIKLTGTNQNLFTSGSYYTLYWTRVGTTATLFYKNTTTNQFLTPHGLINGQNIYFDGIVNSSTFPKGMYPITIIDDYKFSVQCVDSGLKPGIVTDCTRSNVTLSIPSNNHGLINGAAVYFKYITDQQISTLNTSKTISYQNSNLFNMTVSNLGLTSGITVEWCSLVTVFIPVNYPKSTLNTYFKYDNIDVDGPSGDLPIFSDFSCVSVGSSSANNIHSSIPNTQRNIYVNTDDSGKNSLYSGSTIQDISLGSANRLNAKTSINLGNNKGIVFKDTIKNNK